MGHTQCLTQAYLPARGIWGITKPQCLVVAAGLTLRQLLSYCCTKCAADGIISDRLGLCYGRPGTHAYSSFRIKPNHTSVCNKSYCWPVAFSSQVCMAVQGHFCASLPAVQGCLGMTCCCGPVLQQLAEQRGIMPQPARSF